MLPGLDAASTATGPGWWHPCEMAASARPTRRYYAGSPFQADPPPPPAESYPVGGQVHHDRHGIGTVVSTEGDDWVTARFGEQAIRVPNDRRLCRL